MAGIFNKLESADRIIKSQGQSGNVEMIKPREMKMEELIATLDKMSHKGIMPVPYRHGFLSSSFMGRDGVAVGFDKFTFDRDRNTYTAHMEEEGIYVDISSIGQEGVEVGLMNLKKQQLEELLGTDNEFKLSHPIVLPDFYHKGSQTVVDSVMLTDEYSDLVLTYHGQDIFTDGKVEIHEFDPDEDNISFNASSLVDLCDYVMKDIQQQLDQSQNQTVENENTLNRQETSEIAESPVTLDGDKLEVGMKVIWNDPESQYSDPNRIYTIDNINGEVISISDEYSEVEVGASELSVVSPEVIQNLKDEAKQAIHDRITNSWQKSFTSDQVEALNRYHQVADSNTPAGEVFKELLQEVTQKPDVARLPEKWINDTSDELDDLAEGNIREESQQLKR